MRCSISRNCTVLLEMLLCLAHLCNHCNHDGTGPMTCVVVLVLQLLQHWRAADVLLVHVGPTQDGTAMPGAGPTARCHAFVLSVLGVRSLCNLHP